MSRRQALQGGMLASLRVRIFKQRSRRAKRSRAGSHSVKHSFVGRDMARGSQSATRIFRRWLPAALIGVFLATLALAALRDELIEVRYAIVAAVDEEARLRKERDQWIARVQELRNPARLSALANEIGLARPDHTIDLRTVVGVPVVDHSRIREKRLDHGGGLHSECSRTQPWVRAEPRDF